MPDRSPPLELSWSGHSDVGRFRQNNEDTFLGLQFDGHEMQYLGKHGSSSLQSTDFVFAVSDGMGGKAAGEFASKITIEQTTRLLPRSFRQSASGLSSGFSDVLEELLAKIHKAISDLGRAYEECRGMGATLSLAWFTPGWLYFAHVGDSRIYYLPKTGPMKQLTHDHTRPGWLRRRGEINEREARNHPAKNSLQQSLGSEFQFLEPQIGAVGCEPGDRFLICSDGLVDGIWDHHLEDLLRDGATAQTIVEEAVQTSGRDNTTAVIIDFPVDP
ncbi:PP2C family protein-serine/threonine phosphatase [Synoicihabitans lomoniglobus]|uniref:Protein phosphatase 2C domain-containing protein n=1 Tax=Synoicihabitans lomoniglobus TaxID=2909285 RepID=A0AAF0CPZ6_9BACT|nr:protein phosphatase 2C domain-containing protein [Opitutaceae bacterium LMO-M01]WED65933.1 protein phosphatase 2C domain-containing protein [Opitutaceae bacterium LMO-M01]